ncbi:hypothetical protein Syun_001188 [Stephania yunnanensis]|uniref:Uncharacterized protein n=1 Tax=Stephania yunnanensis TaxID=152371 RepID=A0AAP0LDD2_9MAGN
MIERDESVRQSGERQAAVFIRGDEKCVKWGDFWYYANLRCSHGRSVQVLFPTDTHDLDPLLLYCSLLLEKIGIHIGEIDLEGITDDILNLSVNEAHHLQHAQIQLKIEALKYLKVLKGLARFENDDQNWSSSSTKPDAPRRPPLALADDLSGILDAYYGGGGGGGGGGAVLLNHFFLADCFFNKSPSLSLGESK